MSVSSTSHPCPPTPKNQPLRPTRVRLIRRVTPLQRSREANVTRETSTAISPSPVHVRCPGSVARFQPVLHETTRLRAEAQILPAPFGVLALAGSPLAVPASARPARYCVGVSPVYFLNTWLKCQSD